MEDGSQSLLDSVAQLKSGLDLVLFDKTKTRGQVQTLQERLLWNKDRTDAALF